MKKLNLKKLNQFIMTETNSYALKNLVNKAVDDFVFAEIKNPICITILTDLGLLIDQ